MRFGELAVVLADFSRATPAVHTLPKRPSDVTAPRLAKIKMPNKSPEPTPGIARFSQGSVVFDVVAGVAHLER